MAKKYTGNLTLEWYNKQLSILLSKESEINTDKSIPAPKINWVNRDDSLFYEIIDKEGKGLAPYCVSMNDIRVKEARPLVFQKGFAVEEKDKPGTLSGIDTSYKLKELKFDSEEINNIVIKGDNLLALNSLKKYFDNKTEMEKIKCIYIDPPYNTGDAFENYDDNLAHSEWLTLMRDRLLTLHSLLRDDGFIFVQIDENEQAYLKILLDEIFGRENLVNQIVVKTKPSAGASGGGEDKKLKKNVEYILSYCKSKEFDFSFSTEKEYRDLFEQIREMEEDGKSWKYTSILLDKGSFVKSHSIKDGQGNDIKISKFRNVKRSTINQLLKDSIKSSTKQNKEDLERKLYFEYFEKIFSD